MANEDLRLRITAQIQGLDSVESLKNAVRQLQTSAAPAAADLQKLKNAAMQLGSATDRTENDLRRSINALKDVRAQLAVTGAEYKSLTKTINEYQLALDKATGAQRGGGGSRTGQAIGAIASGAIFGGPEGGLGGLLGAGIGAATGGGAVAGAFAGAAVGATAGLFRQQITGASDYAAELARMRIALKGVSTDQAEFNKSLSFINNTAPQFLMSIGDATKNYTKLQASVRGAGMGVDETQKVFQGLSAAIVATGGGTEQLNGAMLAATQVFSKGKVSAEELRGQIGERLPGAFTIFAQAVNMTPQQLDKALEQGKISTEDFVKFAEELYKRYGESAKAIGDSPFAASVRFQIAMDNFRNAAGSALLPIISQFQNFGTDALNALTRVAEGTTGWQKALGNTFDNVSRLIGGVQGLKNILSGLTKTLIVLGTTMAGVFAVQNIGTFAAVFKTVVTTTSTLIKVTRELLTLEKAITALKAIQAGLQAFISSAGTSIKKNAKGALGVLGAAGVGGVAVYAMREQIDAAIGGVVDGLGKQFENIFKMPELGNTFGGPAPNVPQPTGEDDQAEREKEAAERQRLDEQVARARIEVDNAIHRNAMELIRKRFEFEQELTNKQRDNWTKQFTGAARTAAGLITGFYGQLDELTQRQRGAALDVMNAEQAKRSAAAMASATSGQGLVTTGVIARTGNTGQSTGPHLDARWADGRRITAADVDRYLAVNGRDPSSFGVTSGYGPRRMFGRNFHRGIDFGTPAGSGISLRGGASLLRDLGFTGAGGYAVEIMTPEGPMRLLHLQGGSIATKIAAGTGTGAQQRRAVAAEGRDSAESVDLLNAQKIQQMTTEQVAKLRTLIGTGFISDYTDQIRGQNSELRNSAEILALRNRLEMEGRRPEFIDGEIRKAEAIQRVTQENQVNTEKLDEAKRKLAELESAKQKDTVAIEDQKFKIQALTDANAANNRELTTYISLTDQATAAQIRFNDALRFRQDNRIGEGFKQGIAQYIEGIGTLKNATAQLTVAGIKGLEDALVSLVTTGTANFREFAASILKDTARMIIQQLVLRTVMQAIGAIGGGGGKGGLNIADALKYSANANGNAFGPRGLIPFAMGGVVNKPTLFKFANGGAGQLGLMGEAGPEAIMPLRRGRDGRLGVAAAGGGSTSVVVNVDASGGTSVSGNAGQADALGRAVSQAVQAELIRQKRPGGLLAA